MNNTKPSKTRYVESRNRDNLFCHFPKKNIIKMLIYDITKAFFHPITNKEKRRILWLMTSLSEMLNSLCQIEAANCGSIFSSSYLRCYSPHFSDLVKRGDKSTSERFVSSWALDQAIIYFKKASRCSATRGLLSIWSSLVKNHVFVAILLKTRSENLSFCASKWFVIKYFV